MGSQASKIVRVSKKMAGSHQDVQKFIKDAVAQEKVVVFSKSYCPYCKLAKDVFSKVKQPIKVYELDMRDDGSVIQETLAQITGFRTVPQVFINGNCVGGGSDVESLYKSGKLEPLLIGSGEGDPSYQKHSKCPLPNGPSVEASANETQ